MKITFPLPTDGKRHDYCVYCSSENIQLVKKDGHSLFHCDHCEKESPRRIAIDPALVWRIDGRTNELVHESVGIFLSNSEKKVLFFELTKFPFGYTIPAGHLDVGETPLQAIQREMREETNLSAESIELVSEEQLIGDACIRGADVHFWHLYKGRTSDEEDIRIDKREGTRPVWLTLAEAQKKNLTFPPRHFIEKYGEQLVSF